MTNKELIDKIIKSVIYDEVGYTDAEKIEALDYLFRERGLQDYYETSEETVNEIKNSSTI